MTTYYKMSQEILGKTESLVEALIKVHSAGTNEKELIQTVQQLSRHVVQYGCYDLLNELLKTALRFKTNVLIEPLIKAGADVHEVSSYLVKRMVKKEDENFLDILINQSQDKALNYRPVAIDMLQYLPEELLATHGEETPKAQNTLDVNPETLVPTTAHLMAERQVQGVPPMLTSLMKNNDFFEFKELADSGTNYHANGEHLFIQACVLKNSKFAQYLMPKDEKALDIINQGIGLATLAGNTDFLAYVEDWQKSFKQTKQKKTKVKKTDNRLAQIIKNFPDSLYYQKLTNYLEQMFDNNQTQNGHASSIKDMVEHYASKPEHFYNAFKREYQPLSADKKFNYINEMFDYALAHNHHAIIDTLLAIDTTGHIDLNRDDIWQNTVDNQKYYRLTHLMGKTNLKSKDLTQYGVIAPDKSPLADNSNVDNSNNNDNLQAEHQEFFKNALPQVKDMMKLVSYYHEQLTDFFEKHKYYRHGANPDARIGVLPADMKEAYENYDYKSFNNLISRYWNNRSMNEHDHGQLHAQLALISDKNIISMFVPHNESLHFQHYASQIQTEHVARLLREEQNALKKQQHEAAEQAKLQAEFARQNHPVLVSPKAPVVNVFESQAFNLGIQASAASSRTQKSAKTQKICMLGQTAIKSEQSKENRIKTIVNQAGHELLVKDLQKQWDKELIETFFRPSEKLYMNSFLTRFLKNNEISLNDLLAQKFKKLPNPGKFSAIMHPHRFVCAYLPELADKLFTYDKAPSDAEIMKIVSDFAKHNTTSTSSSSKSFLTPEERTELRKTQQDFHANQIYTNAWQDKRSASNRSNWSAVKGKMK
jgi:hypothetical protein